MRRTMRSTSCQRAGTFRTRLRWRQRRRTQRGLRRCESICPAWNLRRRGKLVLRRWTRRQLCLTFLYPIGVTWVLLWQYTMFRCVYATIVTRLTVVLSDLHGNRSLQLQTFKGITTTGGTVLKEIQTLSICCLSKMCLYNFASVCRATSSIDRSVSRFRGSLLLVRLLESKIMDARDLPSRDW